MVNLKISHHKNSGRLLPHEHTSYLPLALLVAVVGVLLLVFSVSANAAPPPPQSGSIGLTGTLPAKPPTIAAVIKVPLNGQHFATSPITVSGTCPSGTLVEIYKNNIFAGSTPCDSSGNFSIQIDLLYGENILTAQVYDVLNQAGPPSNSVTVFYDASPPAVAPLSSLNLGGPQLLLETDAVYRGSFPNQAVNVPVTVLGGTPPFALNIQWGDSTNNLVAVSGDSTVNIAHTYKRPGTYKIIIQGTDSKGLVAYLTVVAIVNGQPAGALTSNNTPKPSSKLLVLWPFFAIAITMVVSFWMGERREKRILGANHPLTPAFGTMAQAVNPAPAKT